jgi:hypothetical protein
MICKIRPHNFVPVWPLIETIIIYHCSFHKVNKQNCTVAVSRFLLSVNIKNKIFF